MLSNCDGRLLLKDLRRMYDVVNHAFDTMLNQTHTTHSVEQKNSCVFLVNLNGTTPDTPRAELERMVDGLCDACGDVVRSWRSPLMFRWRWPYPLRSPMWPRRTTPTNGCSPCGSTAILSVPPSRCSDRRISVSSFPRPTPRRWIWKRPTTPPLLAEDFERAEQAIYELERYALNNNGYSISTLKNIMKLCLGTAEEVATSNTISAVSVASTDWRQGIETCETLDELNALIHRFFQFLVTRSEPRQHECSNTAKKILTFLDENYTCPDSSIAMLSGLPVSESLLYLPYF